MTLDSSTRKDAHSGLGDGRGGGGGSSSIDAQKGADASHSRHAPDTESTVPPLDFAGRMLGEIRASGLYREMRYGTANGQYVIIGGRKMINMCSNDYLGMAGPAAGDAGAGGPCVPPDTGQVPSGSRLLSGGDPVHELLESELARSKSYGGALVYPTGYMANTGVIPVLAGGGQDSIIFSDAYNHASIIDGCRLARQARTCTYRHNDTADLESKIADATDADAAARDGRLRKIIVTEGVFSMDGDVAPLQEIASIARRHDAILVVDDAHGDFVMGRDGGGTPDHMGMRGRRGGVHVYTSSLSKALGSFGGYVASDPDIIDLCINCSRQFIYTSALPAHIARDAYCRAAAKEALAARREKLAQNVGMLSKMLESAGYGSTSDTHIMPVRVGDERRAVDLARHMYRCGVYAPAVRYPTVPRGEARLRFSVTAWLEESDIRAVGRALESATC